MVLTAGEPSEAAAAASITISGGAPLNGEVVVAGSKIAAVPIVAATLLANAPVELENLPSVRDVEVLLGLLEQLGARVERQHRSVALSAAHVSGDLALDDAAVTSVHGTVYLLPAMLARFGEVRIARTRGGCQIGERPVEHIIGVLRQFGAEVVDEGEHIVARALRLRGTRLSARHAGELDKYRSGATKTALLLAVVAQGTTIIDHAYTRASITELSSFLRSLGAEIHGDGTSRITVQGRPLGGGRYNLAGDYLEALTYIALAACCAGRVHVRGFVREHCTPELDLLVRMGLKLTEGDDGLEVVGSGRLKAVSFSTLRVDTDAQPMLAAVLATCRGSSVVEEAVWERRFRYADELRRMGASLRVDGQRLSIDGVPRLHGAQVHASDLRAAAALLIAAAAADGTSTISGLEHLPRGYVDLPGRFRSLGVNILAGKPETGGST